MSDDGQQSVMLDEKKVDTSSTERTSSGRRNDWTPVICMFVVAVALIVAIIARDNDKKKDNTPTSTRAVGTNNGECPIPAYGWTIVCYRDGKVTFDGVTGHKPNIKIGTNVDRMDCTVADPTRCHLQMFVSGLPGASRQPNTIRVIDGNNQPLATSWTRGLTRPGSYDLVLTGTEAMYGFTLMYPQSDSAT